MEETPQLSESCLYQEVGKLLIYWSTAADSKGGERNTERFDLFWDLFLIECDRWVLEGDETKISKLKNFYTIIKDPFSTTAKRSKGVRFTEDKDKHLTNKEASVSSSFQTDGYEKSVGNRVSSLARKCFEAFVKNKQDCVFDLFASFIFFYSSDQTYREMVGHEVDDLENSKLIFVEEHILPFMEEGDKVAPLKTTINLFLHVYVQLPEEHQRNLLMNLKVRISSEKNKRYLGLTFTF